MWLRMLFDDAFEDLLAAWRHHDDLRRSRAPIDRLAEARRVLDERRDRVRSIRIAFAAEDRELGSVAVASFCESVEQVVLLTAADALGNGRFRCVCGGEAGAVAGGTVSRRRTAR